MPIRRDVLAGGLSLLAGPALAIDPGVASGSYRHEEADIAFRHAIALERDNTEGLLDHAREIRVALTDREVPAAALYGQAFPPIWRMAAAGQVRGVLLSIDPADRTAMVVTVLAEPEPGFSLANVTLSSSQGLWTRLDVAATRVIGELRTGANERLEARFSAPVFNDRVVADLRAPAAAASEPAQVILARAQALARGDLAAAAALSTAGAAARLRELPPETVALFRRELPKLVAQVKSAKRAVIREQTAVVFVGPGEYVSAAREGGAWKVSD